jgi:hypothetical protein
MKLERLPYEPGALLAFYEDSFNTLGALCERTWHDRLDIVAEGPAARMWNAEGSLHEIELAFAPADATTARDATREVFPGCPLTFQLAEAIRPLPLALERLVLASKEQSRPPDPAVAEKLWRAQFAATNRWRLTAPFKAGYHFSLLALVRCEIQAIDQHWSLRRLALALPDGEPDESLAQEISFAQINAELASAPPWPSPDPTRWKALLRTVIEAELATELAAIHTRQESYLRRELERIDEYFEHYAAELSQRVGRSSGSKAAKVKTSERLAAARAEHARRRSDQVARHEIRINPHLDALLLVAEPAWQTTIQFEANHQAQTTDSTFVPRARKWFRP